MKESPNAPKPLDLMKEPLLLEIFRVNQALLENPNAPLPPEFINEYEAERRFSFNYEAAGVKNLEDVNVFFQSLRTLKGFTKQRRIEQVNVLVHAPKAKGGKKDSNQEPLLYRLRKTWVTYPEGDEEQNLYRPTLKTKIGKTGVKNETQHPLWANNPAHTEARRKFDKYWKNNGVFKNNRDRAYITYHLPNGHQCEIHIEKYLYPPVFEGFIRIEIEFFDPEDSHDFWRHVDEVRKVFPWIGEDKTEDKAWKNKNLMEDGLPESAKKVIKALRKSSREREQR